MRKNKIKQLDPQTVFERLAQEFETFNACNIWISKTKIGSENLCSPRTAGIWRVKNTKRPIPPAKFEVLKIRIKKEYPKILK